MLALIFVVACGVAMFVLSMRQATIAAWALTAAAAAFIWQTGLIDGTFHMPAFGLLGLIGWLPAIILGLLSVPSIRRSWLTGPIYEQIRKVLPRVSDTEQQALEAGTVGFDAEIFSGRPNWERLSAVPAIELTAEE